MEASDGPHGGEDAGEGGPTPPSAPLPENVTATPALPNLVVSRFRTDRDAVRVGSSVRFWATIANIGHLFAPNTVVTLYDGVIDPQHAIASANVDLWDFEAIAAVTWVASGAGVHTIIAYADPTLSVSEGDESDNTASVQVTVSNGQVPGVPDLAVNEGDVGLEAVAKAGLPTTVKVRVRNVGEVSATSVNVRVTDNGVTVSQYAVPSIASGSANVKTLSWTPASDGPHFLNVTVDEGGTIRELQEENNVASVGIGVEPIPGPMCLYNGQQVFDPVQRGEYVIPAGFSDVYIGCRVFAWNVTVYGTLRLLNGSTLIVGKHYPLGLPWPYPVPIPYPFLPRHAVRVESGGLMELLDSRMTSRFATYGYGFEAKAGSAFYSNRSAAHFPWGTWRHQLGTVMPGGLVVRTANFAFQDSTVAFGRLHGMYLAPGLGFGTLSGDTFTGNNEVGLAIDGAADATVTTTTFSKNLIGVFTVGSSPRLDGDALSRNRYGVWVSGTSSTVLTNSTVTNNTVAGARFEDTGSGTPQVTHNPNFAWNGFGAYARNSSLRVDNTSFNLENSGPVFDASPSGVLADSAVTAMNYTVTAANGSAVQVHDTTLRIGYYSSRRVPGVTYNWTGASCADSTCDFARIMMISVCEGIVAKAGPALSVRDNTTITILGCGNQRPLLAHDFETTTVEWSDLSTGQEVINVRNTTLVIARNELLGKVTAESCPGARIEDNDVRGQVYLTDCADVSFLRNAVMSERGLYLQGSPNATVTDNTFTGIYYWSPTVRPALGPGNQTLDSGHIAVYFNSSATIVRNRFVRGVWGVSLDDRNTSGPFYRNTYALIENNSFDDNGFLAIGVDTTARADIQNNWINRSSGWAIQMESGYPLPSNPGGPGNTVTGNWVNDTNGLATYWYRKLATDPWVFTGAGCDTTTIQLYYEDATKPGYVEVWQNHVQRANGTGIRICSDKAVYVHDNVIDGGGTVENGTFAGPGEPGITLHRPHTGSPLNRIQGNTVQGFGMGLHIKTNTSGWDVSGNDFAGNGDGALVGWGDVANGYAWADLHDNVIRGNVNGVNVSSWEYIWWGNVSGQWAWRADLYAANATLRDNNITGNVNGVYITFNVSHNDTVIVQWTTTLEPNVAADHNKVTGNAVAGVYLRGTVWNGTTYSVWANLTGNNTIASNAYGVWIDGPTVDPTANHFWLWWNDVRDNVNQGVHVEGNTSSWGQSVYFRSYCNLWNDTTGPYDPTRPPPLGTGPPDWNPDGQGQYVSDYFHYRNEPSGPLWWLKSASSTASRCAP